MNYGFTIYFIFILFIIIAIILKKKPILIGAAGLLAVGVGETGSFFDGVQVVFKSLLTTATELLPIILLIGLVVAMTNLLRETETDKLIIQPFLKIQKAGWVYWILGITLWLMSLFLWPTPAVTLMGAVVLPIIANTRINPVGLAMGLCIFGEGIGLAGDYIIQGAPGLLASSAGIDLGIVIRQSIPLVLGSGLIASMVGFWKLTMLNKKVPEANHIPSEEAIMTTKLQSATIDFGHQKRRIFALITILIYVAAIIGLLFSGLRGDSAAAVTGGITIVILIIGTLLSNYKTSLTTFVQHIQYGLRFSMEVFAPIVVIAGFFILGTEGGNEKILFHQGPGYLEQFSISISGIIELNLLTCSIIIILVAMLGAMSGSGFSALPLVGGIAAALGQSADISVVQLAVLGQVAAIWTDAMMIPWGFPAVVSAVTKTEAIHIVRHNMIPWLAAMIFIFIWTMTGF